MSLNRRSGQALAETVLLLPLIGVIIISLAWFSRVLITRQQLVAGARYGTDLIVSTDLTEQEVREEVRNFLSHRFIQGRRLDPARLTDDAIRVTIADFPRIEADVSTLLRRPQDLFRFLSLMADPLRETSSVEVRYPFDVPSFMRPVAGRQLWVSARSETLSGTGCTSRIHRR